jgi:uncharacterized protein YjbI with pentapeptide repeats
MSDRSDDPESGPGEPKPPKKKAEDNPWYLLATLYGVPKFEDRELHAKNRIAWNRYFAANLGEETRTKLIVEKRHPAEELTSSSPEELQEVATAFAKRSMASGKELALPVSGAGVNFSDVQFEQYAFFEGYLFSTDSLFLGATFSDKTSFDGATFSRGALFGGATFSHGAHFGGATFSGWSNFAHATFSGGGAYFDSATFSVLADFGGATFSGWSNFADATFSDLVSFCGATFSGETTTFSDVAFSGVADFGKATFGGTSSFVNAEMKGETSFEGAMFKTAPPKFFGAKLHQGTVWRGIDWPTAKKADKAGAFIDAYACLKLEMDRLKKHEDELDFFAREMQSRRVWLGPWRSLPIALYELLSNYGRSNRRM